jgi:hypothetical protein
LRITQDWRLAAVVIRLGARHTIDQVNEHGILFTEIREQRRQGSQLPSEGGASARGALQAITPGNHMGVGEEGKTLREAHEEVEPEEDPHLYHTTGWTRELWIDSLGIPAVLPPPEEEKDVKTAIGAARAKRAREDML